MTWAREGNFVEADKAFDAVAERAHVLKVDLEAAQAHRNMSFYQTDDASALKHLDDAEACLSEQADMTQSDREQERARILQYRAVRAAHAGNQELADRSLHQLEAMATASRDMIVQNAYQGAAGSLLASKGKFAEAIPYLEGDRENPYSMALLSHAYSETAAYDKMHEIEVRLRSINVPTMEQAMVVPAARAKRPEGQ